MLAVPRRARSCAASRSSAPRSSLRHLRGRHRHLLGARSRVLEYLNFLLQPAAQGRVAVAQARATGGRWVCRRLAVGDKTLASCGLSGLVRALPVDRRPSRGGRTQRLRANLVTKLIRSSCAARHPADEGVAVIRDSNTPRCRLAALVKWPRPRYTWCATGLPAQQRPTSRC